MSKFLHDNDNVKAIAIPQVFSEKPKLKIMQEMHNKRYLSICKIKERRKTSISKLLLVSYNFKQSLKYIKKKHCYNKPPLNNKEVYKILHSLQSNLTLFQLFANTNLFCGKCVARSVFTYVQYDLTLSVPYSIINSLHSI